MSGKRALLAVLVAGVAVLVLSICSSLAGSPREQLSATASGTWILQGRVYEGDEGQEPPTSQALEGVVVSAYGSNNPYPDDGTFIVSTTTDANGWYGLEVPDGYDYYKIRETDPDGYTSVGATTVSGTVRTANWIEYAIPMEGKTLTGNKFWDLGPTVYFTETFDDGSADGWELQEGWVITDSLEGGYLLHGSGPRWAIPDVEGWVDYRLTARVKLITGTAHINFRMTDEVVDETNWVVQRYYLGLKENRLYVKKQIGLEFFDLYADDTPLSLGSWHTVTVSVEDTSILVHVDDTVRAELTDSNVPLLFGRFSLEALEDSQVDVDDIQVTGPPLGSPSSEYRWTRLGGPSGGLGYDVRICPGNKNIMYVTDNPSGVNKSYNAGSTWTQRNTDIEIRQGSSNDEIPIFSLTIDPNNPNIVWAGTQHSKGVYRSITGGETWEKRVNGISEGAEISFRNFGIHPTNSDIVFAGVEIRSGTMGKAFNKTKGMIYKTNDSGLNWYPVTYTNSLVRFVLFDHTDPLTMYASTGIFDREAWADQPSQGIGAGILKSTNGGVTWTAINNGIPQEDGNRFMGFMEMHPTNPLVLFAASGNNTWGKGGVFRTTDGGLNWTKVLSDDIFTLVTFSPSEPNIVYAGSARAIWRSDEGGDIGTWQKLWKPTENAWGPPGVRAGVPIGGVVDPDDPMTIFINNYQGGNFKSTDGGATWENASKGYTGASLIDMAIDGDNPELVYVVGRSGPFKSVNAGKDWIGMAYSPASFPEWYGIASNPDEPQELLLADEHEGAILKSTDGGASWTEVFNHPTVGFTCTLEPKPQKCYDGFKAIAYAPSDPSIVYAGMCANRGVMIGNYPARASHGMYKSTDYGDTWMPITTGLTTTLININTIAVHPTDPNTVYIGTWKDGVYKTTNGGATWGPKNNGLTSTDVRSLAIDPSDPQVIYAGLGEGQGIAKSVNGGELWGSINLGLSIECPSYLLPIGAAEQGISLEAPPSLPLSQSYSQVPWTSIWDIVIDPTDSQTIYAADQHSGVYLSTNGGVSWAPINEGLTMKAVTELDISSDGQVVYAATWGGGVFRMGEVLLPIVRLPMLVKSYP